MNRRRFLRAALVSVAPLFLAEAFAAPPALTDMAALADAYARAHAGNRPLFVIVIPADQDFAHFRGQEWGRLLNEAEDAVMALLGQAEVVCAYDATVRAFAPQASGEEPWLWAIATNRIGGRALAGTPAPLAEEPEDPEFPGMDEPARQEFVEALRRKERMLAAGLIDALRGALTPLLGRTTLKERAEFARRAIVALRESAPANSGWAHYGGCGRIEPDGMESGIMCGMAAFASGYRRFLYFTGAAALDRW